MKTESVIAIFKLIEVILSAASRHQKKVDAWTMISEIARENAEKPGIEGYTEHQ